MSWNKNTIDYSQIGNIKNIFDIIKYPYRLENTIEVRNDGLDSDGPIHLHTLYFENLEKQRYVLVEKICRSIDCDIDDCIESDLLKIEEYDPETFIYDFYYDKE